MPRTAIWCQTYLRAIARCMLSHANKSTILFTEREKTTMDVKIISKADKNVDILKDVTRNGNTITFSDGTKKVFDAAFYTIEQVNASFNGITITECRVTPLNRNTNVKAVCTVVLNNAFAIRGIRVMETKTGGLFIGFPSRENTAGEWEDIAFPLSKDLYYAIADKILDKYQQAVK